MTSAFSEYPTKTQWTLYYDSQAKKNLSSDSYSSILNEICLIDTIPELLYVVDNIEAANLWPLNSNVHFFRQGIQPLWEDIQNAKGGKWVIELPKNSKNLSELWNKTLLYTASEMIDLNKEIIDSDKIICGCVLSPRRNFDRIALWLKTTDENALIVGKEWKKILNFEKEMCYKIHENSLKGIRERGNNLYLL